MAPMTQRVAALGKSFGLQGTFLSAAPCGGGHINDTYAVSYQLNGSVRRFIHQRINRRIFTRPDLLMRNIERVTQHLRGKVEASGIAEPERRTLTLVPTTQGTAFCVDPDGDCWRTYLFIENARSRDVITHPDQAREAARAFGEFQRQLADLPAPRLKETLPGFHHTPERLAALQRAIESDALNRAAAVQPEIAFALAHEPLTRRLVDLQARREIPERITHNDTKLNNVLLDIETGQSLCVIDLDTVMPGLALYDFGDMVRTGASPTPEDERDLDKVGVRTEILEALAEGYLEAGRSFLTSREMDEIPCAGPLITLETGIRFLTDHLEGDRYFKIQRPDHNLDRARAQFMLVQRLEEQQDAMAEIVNRLR
jgi:hypothetical protein